MIQEKLQAAQLAALKSKDSATLSTMRYILAQIQNREIEKKTALSDQETLEVLRKIAKELRESIDAFKKGRRDDLLAQSQTQLDIVSSYLPKELSDEALKKEIQAVVEKNRQVFEKNPKAMIGLCVRELKDNASPQRIIQMLQTL